MASVKAVLPLSIALHLVALILLVVIPLAADVNLPTPGDPPTVKYVRVVVPAVPPTLARAYAPPAPGAISRRPASFAPAEAPLSIKAETAGDRPSFPQTPGDLFGNLPPDVDSMVGAGRPVALPPPPSPAKPAGPVRAGQGVREPRKIADVHPVYPPFAQQARVEGTVVLEAVLGRDGRVDQVRILRSVPLLDQAAIDAVRQWRYTPTLLNGETVPVLMTISINFVLR